MEELEKEKRAVTKSIDANAASKKKEADKGEEYPDRTKFWILFGVFPTAACVTQQQ